MNSASWLGIPEVPLPEELMADKSPQLPLNDPSNEERPQLRDQYLETQYLLYRYEATEPLRRAIQAYRAGARRRSNTYDDPFDKVNMYAKVQAAGFALHSNGAAQRLRLSDTQTYSEEEQCLVPGRLVALSTDDFRSERPQDMVADPTVEMVMLEPTSGYFEALRHTMVALQSAVQSTSVLDNYLFQTMPQSVPTVQYLQETSDGEPIVPDAVNTLDESQEHAFREATKREVVVIQGPPGTGKTFTSTVILQSLVETQRRCYEQMEGLRHRRPVIVTAQTNHALDQLLKKYMDIPLSRKVVRLGSRSTCEGVIEATLRQRMEAGLRGFRPKPAGGLYHTRKKMAVALREGHSSGQIGRNISARELQEYSILTEEQYLSLQDDEWESNEPDEDNLLTWLGNARVPLTAPKQTTTIKPRDSNRHNNPNEDCQKHKVDFIPLPTPSPRLKMDQCLSERSKHLLENARNLYDIRPEDRYAVYQYLEDRVRDIKFLATVGSIISYDEVCKSIQRIKTDNKVQFIQNDDIEVVGCTVSGLLKFRDIVSSLHPRVLLMEEAAEVREGDAIAALLPSLEHLILLGDHQQLQPHVDLVELSHDPYRVNVSMFERLVGLGLPYQSLTQQRRMIPRLRKIVGLFYPKLTDHPSILKLSQNVPGVAKPLWWFHHTWPQRTGGLSSVQNYVEAQMVAKFAQYLVRQGVDASRITMLTYYKAQASLIKQELAKVQQLNEVEWSVRTIDGFQGEENDIIILSLVRGPNGNPGFVSQENRAIVALSRARLGLYIFGHVDVLLKTSKARDTWEKVIDAMNGNIGQYLPLKNRTRCGNIQVRLLSDWRRIIQDDQSLKTSDRNSSKSSKSNSSSSDGKGVIKVRLPTKISCEDMSFTSGGRLGSWLANVPVSPTKKPSIAADITHRIDSNVELISFSDSVFVPLQQPCWPLEYEVMRPDQVGVKEELLIEFSDDSDGNEKATSAL